MFEVIDDPAEIGRSRNALADAFSRNGISGRDGRIVLAFYENRFPRPAWKKEFGISRQRAHQIRESVVEKLKNDCELKQFSI